MSEVSETTGLPVNGVDLDEGVDKVDHGLSMEGGRHGPRRRHAQADRHTLDAFHQVERGAEYRGIGTRSDGAGDAYRVASNGMQDAELPQHVVGPPRVDPARGAPQDPTIVAAVDSEDLARASARH